MSFSRNRAGTLAGQRGELSGQLGERIKQGLPRWAQGSGVSLTTTVYLANSREQRGLLDQKVNSRVNRQRSWDYGANLIHIEELGKPRHRGGGQPWGCVQALSLHIVDAPAHNTAHLPGGPHRPLKPPPAPDGHPWPGPAAWPEPSLVG